MPKTNASKMANQVRAEIGKWRGRSRVTKNSNLLAYTKLKSHLKNLEKEVTKEKLSDIANEIGT